MACWLLAFASGQGLAIAQSFTTTTAGVIDGTTTCGGGELIRPVTVSGVGTVDTLSLGLLIGHSWRGDMRISLESPTGTTVQLVTENTDFGDPAGSADNYNIELADDNTPVIMIAPHDTADDLTATPYQNPVAPNSGSLSTFFGETANGVWNIIICDTYPAADDGNFLQGTLSFSSPTIPDLSLDATASASTIFTGGISNVTMVLENQLSLNVSGVTAQINIPANMSVGTVTGDGSFDIGTGVWTLPNPVVGFDSYTMTLSLLATSAGTNSVTGEIITPNQPDADSTPNNNSTTEDDDFAINFNITDPNFPILTCNTGLPRLFEWGLPGSTNGWANTDTTNNYTIGPRNTPMTVTLSGDLGNLVTLQGVNSPETATLFESNLTPAPVGLHLLANYDTTAQSITVTMDLGTAAEPVTGAQFSIADIDLGAAFTDNIPVMGYLNGVAVTPVLSANTSNTIVGNNIVGTADAPNEGSNGTATITFSDPIDQVVWSYENTTTATPGNQGISLQSITVCDPAIAEMTANKSVSMVDPNAYMVPGSEVRYAITVENGANATIAANNIDLNDVLPDNLVFLSATTTGFTGGSFGSPALPAAETDCTGGACVIHFSGASLDVGATGELIIIARIQ